MVAQPLVMMVAMLVMLVVACLLYLEHPLEAEELLVMELVAMVESLAIIVQALCQLRHLLISERSFRTLQYSSSVFLAAWPGAGEQAEEAMPLILVEAEAGEAAEAVCWLCSLIL